MSEQELLDQIQKLAGAINRHKDISNRPEPGEFPLRLTKVTEVTDTEVTDTAAPYRGRGRARRPYQPSRGHPYLRGRASAPVSRHRTLIVNQRPSEESAQDTATPTASSQWVQKRDRHMQLINASVYEARAQARQNEISETNNKRLLERQTQRDNLERTKLYGFLKRKGQGNQISVCGILYRVTAQGNKLEKFQENPNSTITPPKRIRVGGVAFHRSKNGNYWRRGVVAASRTKSADKKDKLCRYFTKTGSCAKGQSCRYIHDPDKLALCPAFLKDNCSLSADQCSLSHTPNSHRSPTCLHFNRGHCDKGNSCRYAHIKTNPTADICRDFALLGYCDLGEKCDNRHVFECPDFTKSGQCPRKGCKLPHVDTATTVRKRVEVETARKQYQDDVDDEDSEAEDDSDDEEEEDDMESDVESEGFVDDGARFEDQLDFMHL